MPSLFKILINIFFIANFAPLVLMAQHYVFIEADAQQPFYVKKGDTLYSSSASGFLIIPKVAKGDFRLVVGFPKAIYPEVTFDIKEVARDRGFHLKQFEAKGWGLFDRTSLEVFMPAGDEVVKPLANTIKKESSPFAELLSGATGDEVLLQEKPIVSTKTAVNPNINKENKQSTNEVGVVKGKVDLPRLIKTEDTDTGKTIIYIDQFGGAQPDTVKIHIDKELPIVTNLSEKPTTVPDNQPFAVGEPIKPTDTVSAAKPRETPEVLDSLVVSPRKLTDCLKPPAVDKDLFTLQKKLLGMSTEEEQITFVERSFGIKCYSSNQALEIASFFLNEDSKMNLFKRIYWLVSDQIDFKEAGSLFFKEENIEAFRKLQSGN